MTQAAGPRADLHAGTLALVCIALLLAVGIMLSLTGVTPESLGLPLRVTARVSALLFAAAFALAGVQRLQRWQPLAALAFVACHTIHLLLILARAAVADRPGMLADPVGILAYLGVAMIALAAVASARAKPVPRAASLAVGLAWWIVWAVFVDVFLRPLLAGEAGRTTIATVVLAALFCAAFVRLAAQLRRTARA